MKNPKLIVKPFAKNGQKNVIPENYETSMDSNQATWDQGFGQITMLPVAAGGLPPKGQDFNGILNQISENIVYQSQGGRFKFSPEYAESIGGYPKGAILQSDDEKKEYQSLIDNNKVNFNTTSNISASWELIGSKYAIKTEVDLALLKKFDKENVSGTLGNDNSKVPSLGLLTTELGKKQPAGNYQPAGDYATNAALKSGLDGKLGNTGGQVLRNGSLHIYNSGSALLRLISAGDNSNYIAFHNNNSIGNSERTAYVGFGENDTKEFRIQNEKAGRTLTLSESGLSVSGLGAVMYAKDYKTDRNGCLKIADAPELSDYPVGSPIPWPQATVPTGYLAMNGQSFNKATYPLLAKAYPAGVLDDMRAEFIRGADAGRGVDSGRTVLSKQGDAVRNITGSIYARPARTTGASMFSSSGAFVDADATFSSDSVEVSTTKNTMKGSELDISRVVPTANENRPRNIAFLYIVRAA
ncbi:hypothetical protein GKR70_01585 [Providencia alcalifaciens]|uniref:phage tail protein n=1 Tax=Providencia alcalifaciens TaxID=126385 RepID=UPI0012B58AEC|nr:phage tail protein [Providencia alcalifaciens]MTC37239.1 hypothetical protein [Providencia alcalifaciens]